MKRMLLALMMAFTWTLGATSLSGDAAAASQMGRAAAYTLKDVTYLQDESENPPLPITGEMDQASPYSVMTLPNEGQSPANSYLILATASGGSEGDDDGGDDDDDDDDSG